MNVKPGNRFVLT